MRVLLVEDDDRVAGALTPALARHGMTIDRAVTGTEALARLHGAEFVLLDLGLPDLDGLDLCRSIRQRSDVPIIVVSARGLVEERIQGLRCGADDYLVKPYDVGELVARVRAVERRRTDSQSPRPEVVRVADVEIDICRFELSVAGEPVALSRKEFQLLAAIAAAGGDVCKREWLIAEVWGDVWPGANRTLEVHVATLRSKIGRPGLIETVRGVGYRLVRHDSPATVD